MEIECWENTADTTDIKSIKEYTTNNCTSIKSIIQMKWTSSLKTINNQNHNEIWDNWNRPNSINGIEFVIKNFQKNPDQTWFTDEFYPRNNIISIKSLSESRRGNSFQHLKQNIVLILKLDKDSKKKV